MGGWADDARRVHQELIRMEIAHDFTARLARRQGWDRAYAQKVDREYRRFLMIAWVSKNMVVPSDAVDAAWHEHILHTRHYSEVLPRIFGRALHHEPGSADGSKDADHLIGYRRTLEIYRILYGKRAPEEIWPKPAGRRTFFEKIGISRKQEDADDGTAALISIAISDDVKHSHASSMPTLAQHDHHSMTHEAAVSHSSCGSHSSDTGSSSSSCGSHSSCGSSCGSS